MNPPTFRQNLLSFILFLFPKHFSEIFLMLYVRKPPFQGRLSLCFKAYLMLRNISAIFLVSPSVHYVFDHAWVRAISFFV